MNTWIKNGPLELSMQQAQKKPNKHESNNNIAWMTEWHNRSASRSAKEAKDGLEKE